MHDVFVSYSSKDKLISDEMVHVLEEKRVRCWIAPRNILAGTDYSDAIDGAIKKAKVVVFVYSQSSLASFWCKSEINLAVSNGKIIVPFKIDKASTVGGWNLYLANAHWIDAVPDPKEKFGEIVRSVMALLGREESSPPVPAGESAAVESESVFKERVRKFKTNDGVIDDDEMRRLKSIDKIIEDRLDSSLNPVLRRRRMRRIILMGALAVIGVIAAWIWLRGHEACLHVGKTVDGGETNASDEALAWLVVHAKIGGADAGGARICGCSGASDDLNEPVRLPRGEKCGPLFVTAQKKGKEYSAVIERIEVDWKGSREIDVELLMDPEPGTCIALPLTNDVPIYMVWCPKGEFKVNVYDREDEKDGLRTAEVGHGFWISKYEYTQEQDDALWGRPVQDRERAFYPRDFNDFKRELKTWKKLERLGLRMPHIGEWCRACQYGGWNPTVSNVIDYACIGAVSMGRPNPTGVLKPNKLGLYDIYGNVSERVWGLAELCVGLPNPMPKFVDDNESHTVGGDCHSHPFQLAMFLFDVEMIVKQEFSTIRPVADRIPKWREFVVENGEDRQAYGKPPKSTFLRNEKWSADQKENYRRKMLKDENAQKPILEYWGKIVL